MAGTPLDDAQYISLRSFRKDGTPADTPVWTAPLDGGLVVFTLEHTYKVKRIRRNPAVEVARCDVRGKLKGPWLPGRCEIVARGDERERAAYRALNRKYGLLMRVGTFFSTLVGNVPKRRVLCITLDG